MNLISLSDLSSADVRAIWSLVGDPPKAINGKVAWSFEGYGIRTRTTFIQAFRDLGLAFTELPNFLKTPERVIDLAGYLDAFYDLYVIRESDHARLRDFATATSRPVINAMSSAAHPCEVLTDAYFVETTVKPITQARICLWGPPTNVLRSWHELAAVFGFGVVHVCHARHHTAQAHVEFIDTIPSGIDLVVTDGWPKGAEDTATPLNEAHLTAMGQPLLLPTPPFSIGLELAFDPVTYAGFVGYRQKDFLLPVQRAIVRWALRNSRLKSPGDMP